jgi:glycosyltransferase involved in cell wall biosynthesis
VYPADRQVLFKNLLFFGRIESYKGLDVLLSVLDELDDTRLTVCGLDNGSEIIAKLKSNKAVRYLGFVDDSEVAGLISSSDACIFPYTSGTGTQTVQSCLANGCPVIMSDIPMFSDNFCDDVGTFYFESGNETSLRELLLCSHDVRPRSIAESAENKYCPVSWLKNLDYDMNL